MFTLSLKGRRAVVCGATQGIGRAIAYCFAELGAEVLAVARNEEKLEEVVAMLPSVGTPHLRVVADFLDPDGVAQAIRNAIKDHPPYHILVNNTGGPPPGPVSAATLPDFEKALHAHLFCNHLLAQTLIPGMEQEEYGRIINIISTSVREPLIGLGVSNTVRGAVASWAKTLAREVAARGITVNNILPGPTNTGRLQSIIERKSKAAGISFEQEEAKMLSDVPVGRFADPSEIAFAAAFLASEGAGFITGVSLPVDGGRLKSL